MVTFTFQLTTNINLRWLRYKYLYGLDCVQFTDQKHKKNHILQTSILSFQKGKLCFLDTEKPFLQHSLSKTRGLQQTYFSIRRTYLNRLT